MAQMHMSVQANQTNLDHKPTAVDLMIKTPILSFHFNLNFTCGQFSHRLEILALVSSAKHQITLSSRVASNCCGWRLLPIGYDTLTAATVDSTAELANVKRHTDHIL